MVFSPDNKWLAVGSQDSFIYLYDVASWTLMGICKGHELNSRVKAIDWCINSHYIRSNSNDYELLFFTIPDCDHDPSGY